MPAATRTPTGAWIDPGTDAALEEPGGPRRTKVLVPIDSTNHAPTLIRTAAAFARPSRSEVLALHVTWVPPQLPLSEARRFRARSRDVVQAVQRTHVDVPRRIVVSVRPRNPAVRTVMPAATLARQRRVPLLLLTVLPDDIDRADEIETRMWLARVEGDLTEAGIPHHRLQRAVLIGDHLGSALDGLPERDDLLLFGAPTGLRMLSRFRIRRLRRLITGLDRTIAVYQPEPPPTVPQRLAGVARGTDETGQQG